MQGLTTGYKYPMWSDFFGGVGGILRGYIESRSVFEVKWSVFEL